MAVCRIVALFFLLFCDVSKGGNGLKDLDAGLVLGITQTHTQQEQNFVFRVGVCCLHRGEADTQAGAPSQTALT